MLKLQEYITQNGTELLYTGQPYYELLEELVKGPGDLWHSSRDQGFDGAFPEFVYQAAAYFWYSNDLGNMEECVSWRVNPHAFVIRKESFIKMGGFHKGLSNPFIQIWAFALCGLRYQGLIPLHISGLFKKESISIQYQPIDVYLLYASCFKKSQLVYLFTRWGLLKPSHWFAFAKAYQKPRQKRRPLAPQKELGPVKGNPTVSYIIPTMSRPEFVDQLLEDLQNQTYPPDEVVVIDASPDKSHEVIYLKNYSFKLIYRWQESKGSCKARNEAIHLTTGDYLIFGDDDIRLLPHFIESHLRFLHTYQVPACNGLDVRAAHQQEGLRDLKKYLESEPYKNAMVGVALSFSNANSCVQRDWVMRLEGNDTLFDGGYGEDSDFGIRLVKNGALVLQNPYAANLHLKPPQGGYRYWNNAAMATGKQRKAQPWEGEFPVGQIIPKPSPTILYFFKKHFSHRQFKEYRIKYFFLYFKNAKWNQWPARWLLFPLALMKFKKSEFYANQLKKRFHER